MTDGSIRERARLAALRAMAADDQSEAERLHIGRARAQAEACVRIMALAPYLGALPAPPYVLIRRAAYDFTHGCAAKEWAIPVEDFLVSLKPAPVGYGQTTLYLWVPCRECAVPAGGWEFRSLAELGRAFLMAENSANRTCSRHLAAASQENADGLAF